jgi:hypothetical protein
VWSAGVEPARPAFQAGALPFELRPQTWATRPRSSGTRTRTSISTFRAWRPSVLDDPGSATDPAPPSTSPKGSSTQLRDRTVCGVAVSSVTPGTTPNDVFQATRLPFDPGSPAGPRTCAPVAVLRGGVLEPAPRSLPDKLHAKAHAALPRSFSTRSRESFSLRRGLDFDLTLVQAEHHLWFGAC